MLTMITRAFCYMTRTVCMKTVHKHLGCSVSFRKRLVSDVNIGARVLLFLFGVVICTVWYSEVFPLLDMLLLVSSIGCHGSYTIVLCTKMNEVTFNMWCNYNISPLYTTDCINVAWVKGYVYFLWAARVSCFTKCSSFCIFLHVNHTRAFGNQTWSLEYCRLLWCICLWNDVQIYSWI